MNGREKILKLTIPERLAAAKEKTKRVVDHLLYLIELHENNAIVVYSSTLSAQIPTSHAAHAFNTFQRGMHQFEIVRLCALWDSAEPEKENIPTIIEMVDHDEAVQALANETANHWKGLGPTRLLNPPDDPELHELVIESLQRSNDEFGEQQGQNARHGLRKAIDDSRAIMSSSQLQGIMNLRDKHLAHSLSQTRRERAGPIAPMKYGDERDILAASTPIVEALYCWVNGCSFSFEDSWRIDRKNAKALWEACTFKITE